MYCSYNKDIKRVLTERDNFNIDSQNQNQNKKQFINNKNKNKKKNNTYGEITGEFLKDNTKIIKGMPLRPQCTFSRELHDNNSHLDFNLYDTKPINTHEIQYNDPDNTELCSINKTTLTLTDTTEPEKVCIDMISSITLRLYNNITFRNNIIFNINGLGLYLGLLSLYNGSTGNTEIELKTFCNFIGRKKTYDYITNFIKKNAKYIYSQITFRTYILYDKDMKLSSNYKKQSSIVPIISINLDDILNDHKKLNKLIYNETGSINLVSINTLNKVELNILCVMRINPTWSIKMNNLSSGKFMGNNTVFMNFNKCNIGYYYDKNEDMEILEIPLQGNDIVFGIMSSLSKKNLIINADIFNSLNNNIKLSHIEKLSIPKIVKRTKMRLNTTLKSCGINACFLQTELPHIFPNDDNRISDVLQYCDIILDEKCINNIKNRRQDNRLKKIESIIINNEFIYYIRYISENLILCAGKITI
jgi:hypothetical protein